jgi:hypothetical protein
VDKELWAREVDAELIKLQSWPIVMNDIDILLKDDEWLNDNIINAILFMANVGLHEVTKLYGGLSPNPLSTHVVLPTFALSSLYFNHSKRECNQFVKLIQDKKKNSDELKRLNFHSCNFQMQCEIWYATQNFGFMARVLQHYKSKNLTPSHITCVFNRDADFHWVAYDIDISQNIIYEYDPMAFGDPKVHELTPWLAKFLGIFKYQLKSYHGPIYFGPDDMVLTNKHKSDRTVTKRNKKQEVITGFDFASAHQRINVPIEMPVIHAEQQKNEITLTHLPLQTDGVNCGTLSLYYMLCRAFSKLPNKDASLAENCSSLRRAFAHFLIEAAYVAYPDDEKDCWIQPLLFISPELSQNIDTANERKGYRRRRLAKGNVKEVDSSQKKIHLYKKLLLQSLLMMK